MKLLVVTQTIDSRHSNLGFFVRWVHEFAKHCEKVVVIANEVGTYSLPTNVEVFSLGKERGVGRLGRYARFIFYVVSRTRSYDAVFCHMNPEFVIAGAWWWRLLGKRILLWYTHKSVTQRLRLAVLLSHAVATASPLSFRLHTPKLHVLGHGIDTDFFSPAQGVVRGMHALSVGRLTKSKHHERAIEMAKEARIELTIVGEGPELENLQKAVGRMQMDGRVTFLGGLTQEELREEYRRAAYLIHTSETGSLDKVVLEAMATGMPVLSTSEAYKDIPLENGSAFVREYHSLERLIPKLISCISST